MSTCLNIAYLCVSDNWRLDKVSILVKNKGHILITIYPTTSKSPLIKHNKICKKVQGHIQRVVISGSLSKWEYMVSGVLQKSVLN